MQIERIAMYRRDGFRFDGEEEEISLSAPQTEFKNDL